MLASRTLRPWPPLQKTTSRTKGPTEEELRTAMRRVSVTMCSTEWCPVRNRARDWLRTNGISFDEHDVDRSESARRRQSSLNPKGGVPTIDIDGEVMIGFGAEHMQEGSAAGCRTTNSQVLSALLITIADAT